MTTHSKKMKGWLEKSIAKGSPTLQKAGKVAMAAGLAVGLSACISTPSALDQPQNDRERTTEAFVKSFVTGAALRGGDTKENALAGLLLATTTTAVVHRQNQNVRERQEMYRAAGIQATELPNPNRFGANRNSRRVLIQMDPSIQHHPGAGVSANQAFVFSTQMAIQALDEYPLQSYRDVQVLYSMPTGCAIEATQNAEHLQAFIHRELGIPLRVEPITNERGRVGITEAQQVRPPTSQTSGLFRMNGTQNSTAAQCPDDAKGSVSVIMDNVPRR